jgi:hypothetical protein
LGTPFTEPATEAMLMIDPSPRSSMPGSTARMVRIIDFTFRFSAKSRSASVISRIEPACTKPAQLNSTSTRPISPTAAATSASDKTSRRRVTMFFSPARSCKPVSLTSVA